MATTWYDENEYGSIEGAQQSSEGLTSGIGSSSHGLYWDDRVYQQQPPLPAAPGSSYLYDYGLPPARSQATYEQRSYASSSEAPPHLSYPTTFDGGASPLPTLPTSSNSTPVPYYVVSRTQSTTTEYYVAPNYSPPQLNPTRPDVVPAKRANYEPYPTHLTAYQQYRRDGPPPPPGDPEDSYYYSTSVGEAVKAVPSAYRAQEYSPTNPSLFSSSLPPPPTQTVPPPLHQSYNQHHYSSLSPVNPSPVYNNDSRPPPSSNLPRSEVYPPPTALRHPSILAPSYPSTSVDPYPQPSYPPPSSLPTPSTSNNRSPPVLSAPSPPIPAIAHVAANFRATTTLPALTHKNRRRTLPPLEGELPDDKIDRRRGIRVTQDHSISCAKCAAPIANLIFRGRREDISLEIEERYLCPKCFEIPKKEEVGGDEEEKEGEEASYKDTLSAAVDRLKGLKIEEETVERPPNRVKTSGQIIKKRKAEDEVIICDVCTRDIATGTNWLKDSGEPVPFGIEVVCSRCHSRYKRCSDCGGSGGPRLGVGKWRSTELFPGNRKTCTLSHLRLGSISDMSFDVHAIRDIPPSDLDEFAELCRETCCTNIISGLAVPEMLEPVQGLAKNFAEVERMAIDCWVMMEPLLRVDIEPTTEIRRYVALRWSEPPPRKKNRRSSQMDEPKVKSEPQSSNSIIRRGKHLAGYVIVEMDLKLGSLFICIQTPWNMGETFNATTILMQTLLRRIQQDVVDLDRIRVPRGLKSYPRLKEAWIILFHKKTSRLVKDLLNRRGFLPLEEYLEKYGGDARNYFPLRNVFLPPEFTKGWHTLARPVVPNDEWGGKTVELKGKRRVEQN